MAGEARKYREEVYRLRAHPRAVPEPRSEAFIDRRDSFTRIYVSCIPFFIGEYFIESAFRLPIAGLVFPTGFLLFWAFYYTFYRPGFLEASLSDRRVGDHLSDIPKLAVGVAIWFVRVTILYVVGFLSRIFSPAVKHTAAAPPPKTRPINIGSHRRFTRPPVDFKAPPSLPAELLSALEALGIPQVRDWKVVHRRYRELAKKYHPDHNPDASSAGRSFMKFDLAYRKLLNAKSKYFQDSK